MLQWNPVPSVRQASYSEGEVQCTKMLSQKGIAQMLLSAPPVENDHRRFASPCPHEHSEELHFCFKGLVVVFGDGFSRTV